jgi:hypothetical protein
MKAKENKKEKNRPGPKPKMITLYPFTFDEVVDTLLTKKTNKPKEETKTQIEEDKKSVS